MKTENRRCRSKLDSYTCVLRRSHPGPHSAPRPDRDGIRFPILATVTMHEVQWPHKPSGRRKETHAD